VTERTDQMAQHYALLTSLKPDASGFHIDDPLWINEAVTAGLIRWTETVKRCKTCGGPQTDYNYWIITPAGKLFRDAFAASLATPK
jgi:hypothetical protein